MLPDEPPDELKRLAASRYQHTAWVHWTMAIDGRRRGWLEEIHHAKIRELLIHTCSRYFLLCPGYCLMPDHAHFLWMGLTESSDQRNATKFFRTGWNRILAEDGVSLQKQSYDHVLDENERNRTEFEDTLLYILKNPERAGLGRNGPSLERWHQDIPILIHARNSGSTAGRCGRFIIGKERDWKVGSEGRETFGWVDVHQGNGMFG